MSYNLPPIVPWVPNPGESVDWVSALEAMAELEMLACGGYGLRKSHALAPEQLSGEWPEAVRWITASQTVHEGQWGFSPRGFAGGQYTDTFTMKLFVALAPRGAASAAVYEAAGWIPRAFKEAYNLNRTLDNRVRHVQITPGVPAQQSWGRSGAGRPNWYIGWLFDMFLQLRYKMEAA